MIHLLPLAVVLVAVTGTVTAVALSALEPVWFPWVVRIEPLARARWLTALLSAPLASGLVVLALALGPCLRTLTLGLPDGCHSHGGPDFFLCLLHPVRTPLAPWLAAFVCVMPVGIRAVKLAWALYRCHRLVRDLRRGATFDTARHAWRVPGAWSFVAGWPRSAVFLGDDLVRGLRPRAVTAVVAHEAAHHQRGDLLRRLIARLLVATHLPATGSRMADALDVAIEQACDAVAARAVGDPLMVAQTLVDARRLATAPPPAWVAAFAGGALPARVDALCDPAWATPGRSPRWAVTAVLALGALGALGLMFDRSIHDAAESLLELLAR